MTPEAVGPLSRPVDVTNASAAGQRPSVEATAEECAALAKDFKLPAIHALKAEYRLTASAKGVQVAGRVKAAITQIVRRDPRADFESDLDEEVEVDFAEPSGMPAEPTDRDARIRAAGRDRERPDRPRRIDGGVPGAWA